MNDFSQPAAPTAAPDPTRRLARSYRFADPDMDLFFVAALSWGPGGGLQLGQAFHVASQIVDGDADSWVRAFADYGDRLAAQADAWRARGWRREAGEARLQAFASYRSAWQFAEPGPQFAALVAQHRAAFAAAVDELALPAEPLSVPYRDRQLPGVVLRRTADAPTILVVGGADTCFEDLFVGCGRALFERGFSVAMVDLPGQGIAQAERLYWEAEAERPIGAVVDVLVDRFGVAPDRLALLGLSLGGYFVARAAGHESRLAAVVASTPFPNPHALFAASVDAGRRATTPPTTAMLRSRRIALWKAGASDPQDFVERTRGMVADPSRVTLPFLSVVGDGDSPVFVKQAEAWHDAIPSHRKTFVRLDAATGADGHCQVNNRLRLVQEASGWLNEVFGRG